MKLTLRLIFLATTCLGRHLAAAEDKEGAKPTPKQWVAGETFHLNGYDVTFSKPVLVTESKTLRRSIPSLTKLAGGDLLIVMSNMPDVPAYPLTGVASFSSDGGLTWAEPVDIKHRGSVFLTLASGDEVLLPFTMAMTPGRTLSEPCNVVRRGERKIAPSERVEVTGWPEPPASMTVNGTRCGGFSFEGQAVKLKNGNHFATLYGGYQSGGIRIVGAESADGFHWRIVGTIARRSGKVNERGEGPSEAALCRLKDGRLMCVYRVESYVTFGQTWSSDEGRTWTEPAECRGPQSVEPSLAVLNDGTVLMSGGRRGLKLWLNADGTGQDWQEIDVVKYRYKFIDNGDATGYTELVILDDSHLLYVYDYGFEPPWGRVEVMRVTIERK